MICYVAPLEGITTYTYRNAHHQYYPGANKYFTPFLSPGTNKLFTSREKNDILPEHNPDLTIVPQILTNQAADFLKVATVLQTYGYTELNLNLGCPSGTVVSKGKGAGFLAHPKALEQFLATIFEHYTGKLSIKTRIGKESPKEWEALLEIFNQFPLEELIIHPRVQKDYYNNHPNLLAFEKAVNYSKNPVVYNGDIFSAENYRTFVARFGDHIPIMLGRGVIANPNLIRSLKGEGSLTKDTIQQFHDRIYEGYMEIMSGERDVLFKMKEIWHYMIHVFTNHEKYVKKIKKAQKGKEYLEIVADLFSNQEVIEGEFGYTSFQ